ncbi:MAG: tetratricopeptide repeat protein [Candidatus Moranbacteria bacterium]|nr:tetratricopeptide repeat protein [Candidatus Moranbacteria bacterium]
MARPFEKYRISRDKNKANNKFLNAEDFFKDYKRRIDSGKGKIRGQDKHQRDNNFNPRQPRTKLKKEKQKGFIQGKINFLIQEENRRKIIQVLDKIVRIGVFLSIFLVPFFFLPYSSSILEYNKILLLIIFIGLASTAWFAKILLNKNFVFKELYLSILIIGLLLLYFFSSLNSINRDISFWGRSGNEGFSFVVFMSCVFLYLLIVNNFKTKKIIFKIYTWLLISSILVYLISLAYFFDYYVFEFWSIENQIFNPVGSIFNLAIFAVFISVLSFSLFFDKESSWFLKILSWISLPLSALILLIINYQIAWIIFSLSLSFFAAIKIVQEQKKKLTPLISAIILTVISVILIFIRNPIFHINNFPSATPQFLPGWEQSITMIPKGLKEDFILGVGPGNFQYLFAKYKQPNPELSNIVFAQSNSFLLDLFSTTGFFFSLLFLILILEVFRQILKIYFFDNKVQPLFVVIGWIALTLGWLLSTACLVLIFLWWLALACLIVLKESKTNIIITDDREQASKLKAFKVVFAFVFIFIVVVFSYLFFEFSRKYLASHYYQKALIQSDQKDADLEKIANVLAKALKYNNKRESYYLALADVYWLLAQNRLSDHQGELSQKDNTYIAKMVSQALGSARLSVNVNDKNYKSYHKLASLYKGLIGIEDEAIKYAIENYQKELDLNPTDPEIYNQIAKIYLIEYDFSLRNLNEKTVKEPLRMPQASAESLHLAEKKLNKALEIDPGNITTRMLLASVYELKNEYDQAIKISKEALELYPNNHKLALNLGIVYYKADKFDLAKEQLIITTNKWNNYSDAYYTLGLVYIQKDQPDKALNQFEKVKELNPQNTKLDEIIRDIKQGNVEHLKREKQQGIIDEVAPLDAEEPNQEQNEDSQGSIQDSMSDLEQIEQEMEAIYQVEQESDLVEEQEEDVNSDQNSDINQEDPEAENQETDERNLDEQNNEKNY